VQPHAVSAIWLPTVITGGARHRSWTIIETVLAADAAHLAITALEQDDAVELNRAPTILQGGLGDQPAIKAKATGAAVIDLPQPESPTIASVSCGLFELKADPGQAFRTRRADRKRNRSSARRHEERVGLSKG